MLIARLRALLVLLIYMGISSMASAAMDEKLNKAASLLKSQDFKSAYQLLEPLETERAGDVDYDYLFGVAATESGHVTRGVFALERVLATNPNHLDARGQIAKAYYQLGENESAKIEFENVLGQQPPDAAKQAINKFLSAIDKNLGVTSRYGAFLDFGVGHDSNINSATSSSGIAVPLFGGLIFNLNNAAVETSSRFLSATGGASFRMPLNKDFAVFGGVQGNQKMNWSDDNFDTGFLDFNLGIQHKKGPNTLTLAAIDNEYYVNSTRFRSARGVSGQWQHDLDASNQIGIFTQITRLEYPGQSVRDADRIVVGGNWGHAFGGDKSPVGFLSTYVGEESERESNVPFLGHTLAGLRVGGQLTLNPKMVAYASGSYEYRDYGGTEPLFLTSRNDDFYDLSVGMRYFPGYSWTIRPQFSYIRNDSNIVINDYDRYILSVNFRHDFNW